jgi:hypothetical protein
MEILMSTNKSNVFGGLGCKMSKAGSQFWHSQMSQIYTDLAIASIKKILVTLLSLCAFVVKDVSHRGHRFTQIWLLQALKKS